MEKLIFQALKQLNSRVRMPEVKVPKGLKIEEELKEYCKHVKNHLPSIREKLFQEGFKPVKHDFDDIIEKLQKKTDLGVESHEIETDKHQAELRSYVEFSHPMIKSVEISQSHINPYLISVHFHDNVRISDWDEMETALEKSNYWLQFDEDQPNAPDVMLKKGKYPDYRKDKQVARFCSGGKYLNVYDLKHATNVLKIIFSLPMLALPQPSLKLAEK